jgi:hypothetical protein
MGPLLPILGLLAAGGVAYKVMTKPRFVGDLAKPGPLPGPGINNPGDQVEVSVPDLMRSNASVTLGTGQGQLPPGTQTVIVGVLGADKNVLQGPITTVGTVPLAIPLGSMRVPRSDVKAVYRYFNGKPKIAREATGNFAGERERRMMG